TPCPTGSGPVGVFLRNVGGRVTGWRGGRWLRGERRLGRRFLSRLLSGRLAAGTFGAPALLGGLEPLLQHLAQFLDGLLGRLEGAHTALAGGFPGATDGVTGAVERLLSFLHPPLPGFARLGFGSFFVCHRNPSWSTPGLVSFSPNPSRCAWEKCVVLGRER